MTAVAATSQQHLARAGLGVGDLAERAGPRGRRRRRRRPPSPVSVLEARRRCGRRRCRRAPRRRCRRGPARRAGRSQSSASAWAWAASFSIVLGSRVLGPGREAEQVRRDGCGDLGHVVGCGPCEVEHEGLVHLGLDVEHVAQLVDPVVEVHRVQSRHCGVDPQPRARGSAHRAGRAGPARCRRRAPRRPSAGTSARSSGSSSDADRVAVRVVGRGGVEARRCAAAAPAGAGRRRR